MKTVDESGCPSWKVIYRVSCVVQRGAYLELKELVHDGPELCRGELALGHERRLGGASLEVRVGAHVHDLSVSGAGEQRTYLDSAHELQEGDLAVHQLAQREVRQRCVEQRRCIDESH